VKNNTTYLKRIWEQPWLPYVLPFVLFLFLTEPARFFPDLSPYLYIAKTIIVGFLLWFWRHTYSTDIKVRLSFGEIFTALFCGLLVLIIWVVPEGYFFQLEQNSVFDPYGLGDSESAAFGWIAVRLLGAALIVPLMEELFWRSFMIRYLIKPNFRTVPIGAFTWLSFLSVAVLFGLEHNRMLVGIIAGLLYGLLLVRQKKLSGVILAHGVTNLGLGIYVLLTGNWMFW